MKTRKRILAAILTAVMMLSILPATAFATESVENEESAPAEEEVSIPAEEENVETTVEVAEEETDKTESEEPAEEAPAEEVAPSEEEAVAPSEEEAVAPSEEEAVAPAEEAAVEEDAPAMKAAAVPEAEEEEILEEKPAESGNGILYKAGADGSGFPASFTYSGNTYITDGDPVALNANFKIQGYGQTNWLNEYNLNGQTVSTGQVYYQIYKSGNRQIVVYEIPSLIEVMEGTGLYISPSSLHNSMVDVGSASFQSNATSYRLRENGGAVIPKGVISNLENGNVTYGFTTNRLSQTQSGTINVTYEVRSGSDSYVKPTYTITYKDGENGEVFADQVYKDQYAVGTFNTPHFKWNGENADPERYGYRFAGWLADDGTRYANSDAVADVKITGNATYTAQWERVSVTVTKEVACSEGVVREDVEHTVTFALWDPSSNRYVTTDGTASGTILTKSVSITPNGVSGTAVFGVDEMIPGHKLDLREVIQVDGEWTELNAANSIFENADGMELYVSHIDVFVNGSAENNNDITFTAGKDVTARVVNTYSADQADHKFVVNKRWVDYKGVDIDGAGCTATITLYQKVGDGNPAEFASITLDGQVDENGESAAWTATFANLPYRVGEDVCTYMAKETACTEGFRAYNAKEDENPMGADEYKIRSGQNIYNKQDYFLLVHTSDNSEERLPFGQYNLTEKVKSQNQDFQNLYGGYYYFDENNNKKPGTASGFTFSTGVDTKPGMKYYLREVDPNYLKPSIYLLYNKNRNNVIQDMYGFVNIDDRYAYEDVGMIVDGASMSVAKNLVTDGIEITRDGQHYMTLDGSSLFGMPGATFGFAQLQSKIVGEATVQIGGYYVTKDNIKVTGRRDRMIRFSPNDASYDAPTFTGWTSQPGGNTKLGLKTVNNRPLEAVAMTSAGPLHARRMLTITAPSEKNEYTITKVYDNGTDEEVVEEGDYTGAVSYASRSGYLFAGWYKDAAFTEPADFSAVSSDMTVYAKYVKNSDVSVAFTSKSLKSGTATLNATVTVKGQADFEKVTVNTKGTSSSVLATRTVKKTGSGKNIKYTTQYKGTAAVKGVSLISSFAASVSWTTPDGTVVSGPSYNCRYVLGIVTVR